MSAKDTSLPCYYFHLVGKRDSFISFPKNEWNRQVDTHPCQSLDWIKTLHASFMLMVMDTFTGVHTGNIRYSLRKHLASLSLKIHIFFKRFFRELDFSVPQTVRALSSTDEGFLPAFCLLLCGTLESWLFSFLLFLLEEFNYFFGFLMG